MPTKPMKLALTAAVISASLLSGCTTLAKMGVAPSVSDPGSRTTALSLTDISLSQAIMRDIYRDVPEANEGRIEVESFYEVVLLVGEVPSLEVKNRLTNIARGYGDVRAVHNELVVGLNRGLMGRAADSLLESKASFTLSTADNVPSSQTNVLVNDGTVYLMGALTQRQADRAILRLQALDGVKRIVKVLDIVKEQPAP
ncbi:BON domain-containing protein [Paraperlucidibaca baekdonensis]|nr:BON domain-containing protein [Paraperlucidibaca baekdonensis]